MEFFSFNREHNPKELRASSFELSPIKAIELAASKIPGSISLAQGIPSFHTPEVIKEFVYEKIRSGLSDKYSLTIGISELREEISLALQKENLSVDPEKQILVTAGSIEGITASILSVTKQGDEVIIPSPSYTSYQGSLAIAGCIPKFVNLDEEHNFKFKIDALKNAITKKTKAILYCSPNNPTGTVFSEENTRELVDLALKNNITLIIDEVYKDFYYTDNVHFTPASIPEANNNVIRICSFSKAYAMTGWRIGFLHSSEENVRNMVKFHDAMVTCAPVVSQYAAIAALRYGETALKEFQNEFRKRRDYTIQRLDKLSNIFDYQLPLASYFVFPRIKSTVNFAADSKKLAYDILDKAHVAVVPGSAFGPSGESHIRISFGGEMERIKEGMDRLQDYFLGNLIKKHFPISNTNSDIISAPRLAFTKNIIRKFLKLASKLYLWRNKVTVIGIVGTRGKTVYKRTIYDVLSQHYSVRAGILSYNTETGLPLSILNLHLPKSKNEKFLFVIKLISKAFFNKESARILILEYGIVTKLDAVVLTDIVTPNYLVITGSFVADPNIDDEAMQAGIEYIAKLVDKNNIVDDKVTENQLLFEPINNGNISADLIDSELNACIGESAKGALKAAKRLSLLMKRRLNP